METVDSKGKQKQNIEKRSLTSRSQLVRLKFERGSHRLEGEVEIDEEAESLIQTLLGRQRISRVYPVVVNVESRLISILHKQGKLKEAVSLASSIIARRASC